MIKWMIANEKYLIKSLNEIFLYRMLIKFYIIYIFINKMFIIYIIKFVYVFKFSNKYILKSLDISIKNIIC